jgi:hypothetical protein
MEQNRRSELDAAGEKQRTTVNWKRCNVASGTATGVERGVGEQQEEVWHPTLK